MNTPTPDERLQLDKFGFIDFEIKHLGDMFYAVSMKEGLYLRPNGELSPNTGFISGTDNVGLYVNKQEITLAMGAYHNIEISSL